MCAKPNLVYVFADQWRRQAVGCMDGDQVITPVMDAFAAESLNFMQAVSSPPLCSPHRAALLTGRYAQSTGVYTNCKLGADIMLSPDEISIANVLKAKGYDTAYIGKWHLDLPEQNVQAIPESGAVHWDAYTPPGPKRQGFDFWYSYGADDEHMQPHYWRDTPNKLSIKQWSPEHETDIALQYLESRFKAGGSGETGNLDEAGNSDKPFALFISWNPPHSPYDQVPDKYKALYEGMEVNFRSNVDPHDPLLVHTGETVAGGTERLSQITKDYYAAVSGLDEQFGRLLQGLKLHGVEDQTIVVLTSDHGELLGSHGMMAKHSWHEESIGVPFFIRWPDRIKPGRTDALLNTVDIMPSLLKLCGAPIPDCVEGNDLSQAMLGEKDEAACSRSAFICAFPGRKEALEAFRAAGLDNRLYGWRGVRNNRYTYVVHKGYMPGESAQRWLYDREIDPYQLKPIGLSAAADHPVAAMLEQQLSAYLQAVNDGFVL